MINGGGETCDGAGVGCGVAAGKVMEWPRGLAMTALELDCGGSGGDNGVARVMVVEALQSVRFQMTTYTFQLSIIQ